MDEETWTCMGCAAPEPPIFLCDAGWWCEACYRTMALVPEGVRSEDLHDGINDGRQAGFIEVLKDRMYAEDFLLDGPS